MASTFVNTLSLENKITCNLLANIGNSHPDYKQDNQSFYIYRQKILSKVSLILKRKKNICR